MLSIYLRENNFRNRKKRYVFKSKTCGTITKEELISSIANANSSITEADTLAVMNLLEEQFYKLINEGYSVQLPMGTFRASVSGTTDSETEPFTASKTKESDKRISLIFEPDLQKQKLLCKTVKCKRTTNALKCTPHISTVQNGMETTTLFTSGDSIILRGEYLKVDPADSSQGLFLCGAKNYRLTHYSHKARRTLIATIPRSIPHGSYTLKVVVRLSKQLLSAEYNAITLM